MKNNKVDISLIITFHGEGILAQMTLNSIERCRLFAKNHGITCEYIWVMDNINDETKRVLDSYPIDKNLVKKIEVSHGDAGDSRNSGIKLATSDVVAIFDGDDYFSENWIERALHFLNIYGPKTILHPEYMITFGKELIYGRQIDQSDPWFQINGLITHNFWTSAWSVARKDIYLANPYVATNVKKTGFGYEDWHWNCETIAGGFVHKLVPETIGFYRRREGSRLAQEVGHGGIMAPSKIFEKLSEEKGTNNVNK